MRFTMMALKHRAGAMWPVIVALMTVSGLCRAQIGLPSQGGTAPAGLEVEEIAPSNAAYAPGDTVVIGLRLKIPAGYHLYANPLGPGVGRPVTIRIEGASGVGWIDIKMAPAERYSPESGAWVWAWEKETAFFPCGIARTVGVTNGSIVIDALICNTSCVPLHYSIPFTVRIDSAAARREPFPAGGGLRSWFALSQVSMAPEPAIPPPVAESSSLFAAIKMPGALPASSPAWHYRPREAGTGFSLVTALLFAFLAGIILNAMPCVLPVLGIKILSFAHGRSDSRAHRVLKSIAFASGVLAVFMLLAALASFANFTWGKQFQDPAALIAIIAIIVIFALGLFDVYTLIVPAALSHLPRGRGERFAGIFFQGVFATLLATPCSGPFLGAVLAWSVTRHPPVIFMVYGALGLGMAFPYVILSFSHALAKRIPKPGPWMEDGKRIMGFLLLAMAAWLLAGLPARRIPGAIFFCLAVAFAVVVYARLAPWSASFPRKSVALLAALSIAAGGGYISFVAYHSPLSTSNSVFSQERGEASEASEATAVWREFSPDSLIRANGEGRTVIVDFTASWCLNCQYNFATALNTPEVTALIGRKNILALKADLTSPNPAADSLLHVLGSRSLPFLAIFPGEAPGEPIVMRDIVVKSRLLKVLGKVK